MDSNHRPSAYETDELTDCSTAQYILLNNALILSAINKKIPADKSSYWDMKYIELKEMVFYH